MVLSRRRLTSPDIVAITGGLVMAGAQIAIPLTSTSPLLSSLTVLGLAMCAFGGAWRAWGLASASSVFCVVGVTAFVIEVIGSRSGFPFGSYAYTTRLQPALAGVPVIVPLAWSAMGTAAYATADWIVRSRVARIVVGALALTAWDVFLDPQMTRAGFWRWTTDAWPTFRGIPLINYLGWLITALIVMAIIEGLVGRTRSLPLLGLYTWTAVMQTIGFVAFFGDAVVGVVGACAMFPFVALAWWKQGQRD